MTPTRACTLVRAALTPDLLSPAWRIRVRADDPPGAGHCYVAAEAVYHLLGAAASTLRPHVIRGVDRKGTWTHWYLRGEHVIVDPTADQHNGDYRRGRPCGFLTGNEPSQRAALVLARCQS